MRQDLPKAYIQYLVHFHGDRDYFECHEVLEEYWKGHPLDEHKDLWVGLIQIAVGLYHHRRGNLNGAIKMMTSAVANLSAYRLFELGIDASKLLPSLRNRIKQLEHGEEVPFTDLDLPIFHEELRLTCLQKAKAVGFVWGAPSDFSQKELIHRHTLRDRSDVIRDRQDALENRDASRG